MKKHLYLFLICTIATIVSSCGNNSSSNDKVISKIQSAKTTDEVRELLNGTTWHYTENLSNSEIEGWIKVSFNGDNYVAYSANPSDGKWTQTGSGTYEIGEDRYANTGDKYIFVKWKGDLKVEHQKIPCEYYLSTNNFQLMVTSSFLDKMSVAFSGDYYNQKNTKKMG